MGATSCRWPGSYFWISAGGIDATAPCAIGSRRIARSSSCVTADHGTRKLGLAAGTVLGIHHPGCSRGLDTV